MHVQGDQILLEEAKPQQHHVVGGPPWLEPLLSANFFAPCSTHASETSKAECNQFCLECVGSTAFCPSCLPSIHKHHPVIQIRRSSYHDVIRVAEIQRALDLSGIQTYIINSARVVFIRGRPQPRQGKGVTNNCHICGRSLLDTFRYCSLGCKLAGIKKYGDMTFLPQPKSSKGAEDPSGLRHRSKAMLVLPHSEQVDSFRPSHDYINSKVVYYNNDQCEKRLAHTRPTLHHQQTPNLLYNLIPPPQAPLTLHRNPKRRKGIPRRAPMGLCYQNSL